MSLFAQAGCDVFTETGTFEGATVEVANKIFKHIYSIELSPEYAAQAKTKFASQPHIQILEGNSGQLLADLQTNLKNQAVVYFLDAHWCVATNTAGETSQCPLLAEIAGIGILNERSVIVIDDARLFLCLPPQPHAVQDWPRFDEVLTALRQLSSQHQISVVNDIIIFYPSALTKQVQQYEYENGFDLLQAMHKVQTYDKLRQEFDNLNQQATAKDTEAQNQDTALQQLQHSLIEKEEVIQGQHHALKAWEALTKQLQLKIFQHLQLIGNKATAQVKAIEETMDLFMKQSRGIQNSMAQLPTETFGMSLDWFSHRLAIRFLHRFMKFPKLMKIIVGPVKTSAEGLAVIERFLRPRLGTLNQHPPRILRLPKPFAPLTKPEQWPTISIVTPSFRQADYIKRTMDSVLDQGYPKLEYIVQDGGSTDGTVEVLQSYTGRLAAWESKPDGGQSQAINLGFTKTSGDIMAWLNSDDILLPGSLHYVADYFAKNPDIDVVYGHRVLINENDQEIGRWLLPPHNNEVLKWADYIPQETLFWRRSLWEKVGGIDESFRFAMDWDLLVRFQDAGAKFTRLPRYLGAFRIHASQKTSAEIGEIGFKEMNRIRERVHGYVPAWLEIRKAVAPYLLQHVLADLMQRFSFGR